MMGHPCYGKLVRYDNTCTDNTRPSLKTQIWQAAYAEQLRGSSGNDFFFVILTVMGFLNC
ncbi:hypothetical protein CBFG_04166 [Clostridiales bacterium 1_7_47FAA]|nr:hypothetical protein CBFG_04166 [Clostridiales bacterium 1_7_47FAA]